MAKYGVDVKSGAGMGGLAEGPGKQGESKGPFGSGYGQAKNTEKAVLKKADKLITPPVDWVDPNVPAAAAAVASSPDDDFDNGFDDGAGSEVQDPLAPTDQTTPNPNVTKPTTKKTTPAYLRGNVAGRMFRRQYFQSGLK